MITGVHAIVFSRDAEADRAFFRDVLRLDSVDAGGGWLIFALPPSELACHSAGEDRHELYLMCDDIQATVDELRARGAVIQEPVEDVPYGRQAWIDLPGGGRIALYQPSHPTAVGR